MRPRANLRWRALTPCPAETGMQGGGSCPRAVGMRRTMVERAGSVNEFDRLAAGRNHPENLAPRIIGQQPDRPIWTLSHVADAITAVLEQHLLTHHLVPFQHEPVQGLSCQ